MKTIKLQPGAFNEELLRHIGTGKIGWDSENHQKLVKSLFPRLHDDENKVVVLNDAQRNVLELVLRPTEELQRTVLKQTYEAAGYRLDDEAAATYELLFNGVQFAEFLYKTNNPATNQPYVTKPAPKGKKATLNKLLAQTASPATAPEGKSASGDAQPVDSAPTVTPVAGPTSVNQPEASSTK